MHQPTHRSLCSLLLLTVGLLPALPGVAQRTLSFTEPDFHYRTGVELFEKNNYAAARQEFQQYLDSRAVGQRATLLNTTDQNAVSAEYYIALTNLYANEPGAEVLVDRFVKNHSEHPKAGQLYGDLGTYYFTKADYGKAISFLEKAVGSGRIVTATNADNAYRLALSYFNTQNLPKALPLLNQIKLDPNLAVAPGASYYAGVINFRQGNYSEAVSDFRRIEQNPTYQNEVPNWIAQAFYKEGRYDELVAYTEPLLRRGTGNVLAEVALYTAEVYYRQGNYAKAIPYYKRFLTTQGAKAPAAVKFRYGQSLFKTGDYPNAITQLKPIAGGRDTTAQYASYTLGISYLQVQNPAYALTAFDQAGRLGFSPAIQEEAQFTHAKLQLDQGHGTEAVREFGEYLKRYPDGAFADETNELTGEAYLASNNYPAAIAYIERLKRRTAKLNATYARLTYNQGVNDYNADRYEAAIASFDKALSVASDADTKASTTFYKAEALSALKKYEAAIPLYGTVRSGENATRALYGLAYAYYNQKLFARALSLFQQFLKAGSLDAALVGDATLRTADCLLAAKQYTEAMRYYDQAIAAGADREYATYQKGMVLTYVGRDSEAQAQFDQVQRQFPSSRFADDALFQTANVDFEKGSYQSAIQGFSRLIQTKPQSYLLPTALLKRAIAYTNLQQYDPAIADYRRILSDYGNTPSAQSALLGLQNALNDAGRPEEFSDVLGQYKQGNPGSTEVEKVQFENAKSLYANEKYAQAVTAFQAFMREYPASPNGSEARYYLAETYARQGDPTNALKYHSQVIQDGKSEFVVRSATRAADLERQQKNWPRAVRNYQIVLAQATGKPEQVAAQLGLMDTYLAYAKPDSAAFYAREVLTVGNVVPGAQNRAQLMLGKVAYAKGDYKTATTDFEKTIALAKDVNGAEANYLIGEGQYKQKKYKESVATLLKFNETFEGFDYWKGKAFILVSDNYAAQNELAQAKAVLNSIIDNATDEAIVTEAKAKLKALDGKN